MLFVCFDPENIFLIMKITNFRGDLTDISAIEELVGPPVTGVPHSDTDCAEAA